MSVSSVERSVSALRQRMLEDMAMRGLRSDTQRDYVRVVRSFAAFLGRSPDSAIARHLSTPECLVYRSTEKNYDGVPDHAAIVGPEPMR
jgi:hypothetical protein